HAAALIGVALGAGGIFLATQNSDSPAPIDERKVGEEQEGQNGNDRVCEHHRSGGRPFCGG
ncbi:MAG: hypothetical protein AAF585_28755, partial [Verrucomicrobiota bacterium]